VSTTDKNSLQNLRRARRSLLVFESLEKYVCLLMNALFFKPVRGRCRSTACALASAGVWGLLAGCAGPAKVFPSQEQFGSANTYSRLFDASAAQTCEAARRALLSQGYIINTASSDLVEGRKSFQPDADAHLRMEIRVVCATDGPTSVEGPEGKASLAFVTALQDQYALKKSNNSASLGVGAFGSVSLPFSSSSDSMVRVGSETIASDAFYDRFFELVRRYLVLEPSPVKVP
jgi:Uncharacterized protein conserved in bacteria (DUF2242)